MVNMVILNSVKRGFMMKALQSCFNRNSIEEIRMNLHLCYYVYTLFLLKSFCLSYVAILYPNVYKIFPNMETKQFAFQHNIFLL